jgi:hypothetical protein
MDGFGGMEMSARSRFMILLVVVFLILTAIAVTTVFAGGFSFSNGAVELVGHLCSSGCTV